VVLVHGCLRVWPCGRLAEARQALYELNKIGAHTRIVPAVFLFAYAGTGAKEQLLATLDARPALKRSFHSQSGTGLRGSA
jgi:hypothetical protein